MMNKKNNIPCIKTILKDLNKKWFVFSKIDIKSLEYWRG